MNRTIWIFRLLALIILLVFTLLMWNLYARLHGIEQNRNPAATAPAQTPDP